MFQLNTGTNRPFSLDPPLCPRACLTPLSSLLLSFSSHFHSFPPFFSSILQLPNFMLPWRHSQMKIEALKGRFCFENKQFLLTPFSSHYTSLAFLFSVEPEPETHRLGKTLFSPPKVVKHRLLNWNCVPYNPLKNSQFEKERNIYLHSKIVNWSMLDL